MLSKLRKSMKSEKGFTLIELMIVVAIIGILAAIAIPNFLSYQKKAKTSEAKVNLGAIRTSEESYKAENDAYLNCAAYPGAAPTSAKQSWVVADSGGFNTIGFAPSGNVYYQYAVDTAAASQAALADGFAGAATGAGPVAAPVLGFKATAEGNLDGDAATQIYGVTDAGSNVARSAAASVF